MGERHRRPEHWLDADWEAKARENPLLAIMTTPEMSDAPPSEFSADQLDEFFARGRRTRPADRRRIPRAARPTSPAWS